MNLSFEFVTCAAQYTDCLWCILRGIPGGTGHMYFVAHYAQDPATAVEPPPPGVFIYMF
jgi:hypothetical protein